MRSVIDMAEEKQSEVIVKLYQNRFKQLRLGHECYKKGNLAKSVEYYSNYLSILAQFFNTKENDLNPHLFDRKKDAGELLLISNVYWSLAKVYDKKPKFHHHATKCLNQFLKFTQGYNHQYANARMLKNYIAKGKAKNAKEFKLVYEKIKINSRTCLVSTYCFGYDSPVTQQLRLLREDLSETCTGRAGIKFYYKHAPSLVAFLDRHKCAKKIALPLIKKILFLIAWFYRNLNPIPPRQ